MPRTHAAIMSPQHVAEFTPSNIAGLKFWLDANDASSFTFASSTIVSQWNDKSGNNFHVAQGTGAAQPNRNGTQNSKATVSFDGSDVLSVSAAVGLGMTNWTAFVVGTASSSPDYISWLCIHNGGNDYDNANAFLLTAGTSTNYFLVAINNNLSALVAGSGVTPVGVWGAVKSGTTLTPYRDGAAGTGTTVTATGTANTGIVVGGRLTAGVPLVSLNGTIAEIIVYDTALSTPNRQTVEAYLKAKWGTP